MATLLKKKNSYTRTISHIWCLARELGLDGDNKDMLYDMVQSRTGYDSISKLCLESPEKAKHFIFHMNGMLSKQKRPKHQGKKGVVIPMPTQAQVRLVRQLESEICCKGSNIKAGHLAERTYGKPINRLSYFQIQGIIEALKSIDDRL